MDETQWKVFSWGFGLCTTGFLFLAGWCWMMWGKINKIDITKERFDEVIKSLKAIEGALTGTLDKRGLITMMADHREEIEEIKENCRKLHK